MTSESKPPDEIQERPPSAVERSSLSRDFHGSYLVNQAALEVMERILREEITSDCLASGAAEQVQVFYLRTKPNVLPSVAGVGELRNPKGDPIAAVSINVTSASDAVRLTYDATGSVHCAAVLIRAESGDAELLSRVHNSIVHELRNTRQLYSVIRCPSDRLLGFLGRHHRLAITLWSSLLLLTILGAVVPRILAWRQSVQWEQTAQAALVAYEDLKAISPEAASPLDDSAHELETQLDASRMSPPHAGLLSWIPLVMALVAGCFVSQIYDYVFPRVTFLIGDGAERYRQQVWARRFLLGSVLLCGVLLRWVIPAAFALWQ